MLPVHDPATDTPNVDNPTVDTPAVDAPAVDSAQTAAPTRNPSACKFTSTLRLSQIWKLTMDRLHYCDSRRLVSMAA